MPGIYSYLRKTSPDKVSDNAIRLYTIVIDSLYKQRFEASGVTAVDNLRRAMGSAADTRNLQRLEASLRALPQ